jgi:hypothetical protein
MSKNKTINFRIEEDLKILFEETCKKNFDDPSGVLYKFVNQYIKKHQGSQISVEQFKKLRNDKDKNDQDMQAQRLQ